MLRWVHPRSDPSSAWLRSRARRLWRMRLPTEFGLSSGRPASREASVQEGKWPSTMAWNVLSFLPERMACTTDSGVQATLFTGYSSSKGMRSWRPAQLLTLPANLHAARLKPGERLHRPAKMRPPGRRQCSRLSARPWCRASAHRAWLQVRRRPTTAQCHGAVCLHLTSHRPDRRRSASKSPTRG